MTCEKCGGDRNRSTFQDEALSCKTCRIARARARRRVKSRAYVRDYKLRNPCIRCGEGDPDKLTFHHRNPGKRSFWIANPTTATLTRIQREIAKCDVLCSDCHRAEHGYNTNQPKWGDN